MAGTPAPRTIVAGMYDEKLVRAAQQGDEAAFAAIYDRAADAVYDLCWSLVGDAEEAGRIVEDTFVLAARHLQGLSDASQVRAWLLAIARDRILNEDEQGTLRPGWGATSPDREIFGAPDEPLGTVALRTWTAAAAAVLALTDQAVLELHLRHQLEDDQLAAAIGCPPAQLPSIIARVDAEAEHVLGALVVARQARRDCPELLDELEGWDGTPTAEVADLVDAHAGTCDRCRRRRALVSPLELITAAPLVGAPAALRNQVLDLVGPELSGYRASTGSPMAVAGTAGSAAGGDDASTTAVPLVADARRRPVTPFLAIAAAVVVLAGALTLVLRSPTHPQIAAAIRPGNLTIGAGPTTSATAVPTTAVPALVPLDTTTVSSTTPPPAARLELNASRVDFGAEATSAQITLRNTGAGATNWVGSSSTSWLALSPSSGHLDSTGAVSIFLVIDRRAAPRGPFEIHIAFQPSDPSQPTANIIAVGSSAGTTTTSAPPSSTTTSPPSSTSTTAPSGLAISGVTASPSAVYAAPCNPDTSTVSASVSDPGTVTGVSVVYSLADGRQGTTPMTQRPDGQWSGPVGPSSSSGSTSFRVVATDAGGARSTSDSYTIDVAPCH